MEKKIQRFKKVYPWYTGFTSDLLFYIAIDTLFLTIVKNFTPAQFVSFSAFSQFACIVLQFPALYIIRKIGNTASTRTGAVLLLLSSIFITFGKNYYYILLGRIFHDIAVIFRSSSFVVLENNLDLIDNRADFVKLRSNANTVYATVTMLISFVASYMFNLNHYLPMIGCITTCAIGVVLSLFMKDYSDYDKISSTNKSGEKKKIHYSHFIILAVVVYSIFYPIVSNGQSDGKLFIQQNLLLDFNVDETSLIIGAIVCVSRIIRVLSNIVFARLYERYEQKIGVALPAMLTISLALMLLGSLIDITLLKIIVMAIGYTIILFARDPFRLYMQDVIFENAPKDEHQTLVTVMEFGVKFVTATMGLGFSYVLLSHPMKIVMILMFLISLVNIALSMKLYGMIKKCKG